MPISRTIPLPTLLWMFLCSVTPTCAATLNVPTSTYPTIQAAVNAAANGDTVLVADGTYSGDGNRDIDFGGKSLTVTSQHGATSTVIDCGGSSSVNHRGFYIHCGEIGAVISGLTIKNGYEANVSGVANSGEGGGICVEGSNISIQNCNISGNTAQVDGGGVYILNNGTGAIAVTRCDISANTGQEAGGGVYNLNNNTGTISLTGCIVSGNVSNVYGGGGVYNLNNNTGTITLTDCTVSHNTTQADAGGILNGNNYVTVSGNDYGTITLIGCTIVGNTSQNIGGGVLNKNANINDTIRLTGCTIAGNTSQNIGGGVSNNNSGRIILMGCTVSGNMAGIGGGVYDTNYHTDGASRLIDCTIALINCTVVSNNAQISGGLYNANQTGNTVITLTNCTVIGNSATQNGGGIYGYNDGGSIALNNDVVYSNTGGEVTGSVFTTAFCDIQGGYTGTGNINADPLFVYAAGGDLHLRPGSPCLGAGTSTGAPTADKDGVARPNPPSIGAYEATPSHTHLLWNNTDARVMLWSVAQDGSFTLNGFGPYTDGAPQNVWHATAVATGPDGQSHLLWNNTDGRVMLWTVDDQGNFSLAGYGPYTDNAPQNKWSAVGVSVGPDNQTHLLWSNTDHRAMLWNVASDFTFTLAGFGPYTDNAPNNLWTATALATGPDGVSRILWNNTDYRVMLWNVAPDFSFTLAGYGPYTDGAAQNKWSAVGVSVGPDDQTHLLWSNTDRRAMFWNVDSAFGFTLAGYGPYTDDAPQNLWTATALATGPDGLSHLLWGNTDYRAMLWGVNNAFGFTVAGYGPYTDNAPQNLWSVTAVSAGP